MLAEITPTRKTLSDGAAGAVVEPEAEIADAAAVGPAARELEQAGYELLHPPRE